ncbi:Uncharacterised protein [Bacteroides pyogenes]|nr:Uncharacterised protein [Bacteroides pyogenes]
MFLYRKNELFGEDLSNAIITLYCLKKKPAVFFSKPAVFDFKARRVFFKAGGLFFRSSRCVSLKVSGLFFHAESKHHSVVILCQRTTASYCGIVRVAPDEGHQFQQFIGVEQQFHRAGSVVYFGIHVQQL